MISETTGAFSQKKTDAVDLDVILKPSEAFSQKKRLWSSRSWGILRL